MLLTEGIYFGVNTVPIIARAQYFPFIATVYGIFVSNKRFYLIKRLKYRLHHLKWWLGHMRPFGASRP